MIQKKSIIFKGKIIIPISGHTNIDTSDSVSYLLNIPDVYKSYNIV